MFWLQLTVQNAERALDFALDLTEKYNAAITILNVSPSLGAMGAVPQENASAYPTGNLAVFAKDIRKIRGNFKQSRRSR